MSTTTFDTRAARALDGDELRALFAACDDGTPAGACDAAGIALMVGCGLRLPQWHRDGMKACDAAFALLFGCGLCRAEAVAVDVADVVRESGARPVRIRIPARCSSGQGAQERTVYATDGARTALDAWLSVRGKRRGPLLVPVSQSGTVQAG